MFIGFTISYIYNFQAANSVVSLIPIANKAIDAISDFI